MSKLIKCILLFILQTRHPSANTPRHRKFVRALYASLLTCFQLLHWPRSWQWNYFQAISYFLFRLLLSVHANVCTCVSQERIGRIHPDRRNMNLVSTQIEMCVDFSLFSFLTTTAYRWSDRVCWLYLINFLKLYENPIIKEN